MKTQYETGATDMIFTDIIIHTFETNGRPATLQERREMRKHCGPYHWTPQEPNKGRGFYQSSKGLYCGDSTFNLRLQLANDVLSGRLSRIDGYFADNFHDSTLTPIIARLPHSRGFLAGWTMGNGMCASLDTATIYGTEQEAAEAAHYDAEDAAEKERERDTDEGE